MRARQFIEKALKEAVEAKGLVWPEQATVEPPRDKRFGDLACNAAMMLAKQAKTNPRQLAEELKDRILAAHEEISTIEVAGPGFLNFTLGQSFWSSLLPRVLEAGEEYGRTDVGGGRKVQVEFVSANPTGPLHIGHGRGAALGDGLTRILRATGHEVLTEYYVNDAGRQMFILGGSILYRARQEKGLDPAEPEDYYKGDYIKNLAREVLDRNPGLMDMEEDEAVAVCREYGMDSILEGIKRDLGDFGVNHEVWFSEKSLVSSGKVEETFQSLRDRNMAYDEDGALWFRSTELGDDKDRVLKKSNGDLTYFASDIAYHDDKYRRGFDLVVDIWGADHHGYVPRMKAAVQALGKDPEDNFTVILVQLVTLLRGGEPVAMSTRAGEFETLADVVQEVGADAARFIFLSRKSDSPLEFDLELVKQKTMENPVYYVQYAHARIRSMLRKAREQDVTAPDPERDILSLLDTEEDLIIFRLLDQYPDILASAARTLSPHLVTFHLRELAQGLHRYYTVNQVLSAEGDLAGARLLLVTAVARVLKNGLNVLGIDAPERM